MRKLAKRLGCGVMAIGVVAAIGLTVEWFRGREIERWTTEEGGAFEAGGLIDGVAVPEAEGIDAAWADGRYTWLRVARFPRGEGVTIVATRHSAKAHTSVRTSDRVATGDSPAVLLTLPGAGFPAVALWVPRSTAHERIGSVLMIPDPPPALPVPDEIPGFAAAYQLRPLGDAGAPEPAALARLLRPEVQRELVAARESLLITLQARGDTVLLVSGLPVDLPVYQGLLALADRLRAIWEW